MQQVTSLKNNKKIFKEILEIDDSINSAIKRVINNSYYTKDNLLCFACSLQPNFLVWSSALALHESIHPMTKEVALKNAREEMFGLMGEGSHSVLSHDFFQQIGIINTNHHLRTKSEVLKILGTMNNAKILLTCIASIEAWSMEAMPFVLEAMKSYGATNFSYIDVHKMADNNEDGHSIAFLEALSFEKPTFLELTEGIRLFETLFLKIFESPTS